MKADTTITLTPALVRDWEQQAAGLEKEAAEKLADAKKLRERAAAGKVVLGDAFGPNESAGGDDARSKLQREMEKIANAADKPLTKAAMKSRLQMLGVPEDQLGNYFYTVVLRLKKKDRISVLDDGRIWRAPVKDTAP
jgi:hypothetical protein